MKFYKEIKEAYGRRDAYQRDYDNSVANMNRPADHRGLSQELAHETNNIQISINGRPWKVIPGRGYADSKEEWSYLNGMKSWAEKKSAATGKKWSVSLTGAPVSEQAKPTATTNNSELLENEDDLPMYGAIIHRIMVAHPELLQKYGPEKIMMAAQDEAEWVGDVEEIGSSDVSISVKRVMQALQEQAPLREFAPGGGDDSDDGFSEETLKQLAKQWYNGDEDPEVEKTLLAGGWEIGQDEGYEDEPGVFVVMSGDINGKSYISWPADELREGVAEAEENPEDVIKLDVPLFIRLLEYAREDANSDVDLHDVAENAIKLSADGNTLSMNNYDAIIPSTGETEVTEATGHPGYDNMLAVMQAVDAGKDATFNLAGEPITLEYPEARFLAGKYKAFLRAGRQEEFLKYMNDPVMFDRLMLQLRQLIDKQKNFRGSVPGERGVEEAYSIDDVRKDAEAQLKKDIDSASDKRIADAKKKKDEPFMAQVGRKIIGGVAGGVKGAYKGFTESKLPETASNEYYCNVDRIAKPIPEGYKKLASGYITRK